MEINENAPGNISQSPVTRTTDNETGFDPNASNAPEIGNVAPVPAPVDEDKSTIADEEEEGPSLGNRL